MSPRPTHAVRLVAGLAAAATLACSGLATSPAHALDPSVAAPVAVSNTAAATQAATWLVSTGKDATGHYKSFSNNDAEALLALVATGTQSVEVNRLNGVLKAEAKTLSADPGSAAKVAIAAAAMGEDVRSYGGVDLVKVLTDAAAADPSFGYAYSGSLAIIALYRANQKVPQPVIDALTDPAKRDAKAKVWGFPDASGKFSADADTIGLALQALSVVPQTTAVKATTADLLAWAKANMSGGTHWAGYSSVNTSAIMVGGFLAQKQDVSKPTAWLVAQQATTKVGAFPGMEPGSADLFATIQALPSIAGASYVTATYRPDLAAAGDATGDKLADVWAVDANGDLQLFRNNGGKKLSLVGTRAAGWAGVTYMGQMTDPVDGKGTSLLTRNADKNLYLNRVDGLGFVTGTTRVGRNWNAIDQIVPVGNLRGGTTQFVVGRSSVDKALYLYKVTSTGLSSQGRIGSNWGGMRSLFGIGDMNKDGKADILAIRGDGTLWAYSGTSKGFLGSGRQVGHGWSSFTAAFSSGDMTGNGTRDLVGRMADGTVVLYDQNNGWFAKPVQIATGMGAKRLMA